MDLRKFRIFVENTGVWKGWDYVILPDGRRISVRPGKYMKVDERAMAFAFEDATEEVGEEPDYDFDEPACTVLSIEGIVWKRARLRCRYGAANRIQLWYGKYPVATFRPGNYVTEVAFSYIDAAEAAIAGAVGGGVATYVASKRTPAAIIASIIGGIIGYLIGD